MTSKADKPQPGTGRDRLVRPTPFSSPVQFLAFGFGSGLSPKAPGTAGTLVAVPIYWLMAGLDLWLYTAVVVAAMFLGIYLCGHASRQLKVHDHPGIVWDEFVGFWITMWAVPASLPWVVAGFLVFRVFDIAKPWPISLLDRKVAGGTGIMMDDVVAGIFACATLHTGLWLGS